MHPPDRMIINLCRPSFPVKQASVIPFHKIICLTKLFPNQSVDFIWRGEILIQTMTFLFYQIAPLSSIVVLPDEISHHQTALAQWLAVTRDSDAFNERIGFSVDPQSRIEASRLRDLRFWRAEKRGIPALGSIQLFNFNEPIASFQSDKKLNMDFEKPSIPSCEPLPNPWNQHSQFGFELPE
jgi:hypothetical protein